MRVRSHYYPDTDTTTMRKFVNTTYYDKNEKYLDLGYQRLKIIDPKHHTIFSNLKKLFIDHNNLTKLPGNLPQLEYLTCANNALSTIPTYPNLTFLNISNNRIIDLSAYHNSKIISLDVSNNLGFNLNFCLPVCTELYISNISISTLNFKMFPQLQILDCANNALSYLSNNNTLLEINLDNNNLKKIPNMPKIKLIEASHNQISTLATYPELDTIIVSYNLISTISTQPKLKKIIANNNTITTINPLPVVEMIDFRYNLITSYDLPKNIEFASLQFNPLTELTLKNTTIIKELEINYKIYELIYDSYYSIIDTINIQINKEKLEFYIKRLNKVFDEETNKYIYKKFCKINFVTREKSLFIITLYIYWQYFPKNNSKNIEELTSTDEFKYLHDNITKMYHKSIVITIYFNGYLR